MGHYLKMSLTVPAEYVEGFTRANNTFLYQLVFDPVGRKAVPLSPYPQHLDVGTLSYAGLYPSRPVAGDSTSHSVLGSFYFEMDLDEAQLDTAADRELDLFHSDESCPGWVEGSFWLHLLLHMGNHEGMEPCVGVRRSSGTGLTDESPLLAPPLPGVGHCRDDDPRSGPCVLLHVSHILRSCFREM